MAKKEKSKTLNISITSRKFTSLFDRLRGEKGGYDFSEISELRKLLSNEKAKILSTIRSDNPSSLYQLAKILKRDFKSVRDDILLLKKVGFIDLEKTEKGNRKSLKPVLLIDSFNIRFEI